MSDAGEKKASEAGEQKATNSKTWTEVQKLGLLFAIINSSCDKINWKEVKLPEGRSLKACQVWLDKQRTELKKLKEAAGGENGEEDTPAKPPAKTPKKRGAKAAVEGEENGDEATPKPKKQRVTKKKTPAKVTAAADDEEEVASETLVAEEKVKAEAENEDANVEMT